MEYETGADEPVSTAVVRAVSAVDGRDPTSIPPLDTFWTPARSIPCSPASPTGTCESGVGSRSSTRLYSQSLL